MEDESLGGWLVAGLFVAALGAAITGYGLTSLDGGAQAIAIVVGAAVSAAGVLFAQVAVIAMGVRMGMARHEYLKGRRK